MKKMLEKINLKIVKISTIILAIILISLIAFIGLYTRKQNRIEDNVKEYSYAMDLNGGRVIVLEVSSDNEEDSLNTENYKKAKEIIEKRLKKLDVQDYLIRLNEQTGKIEIKVEENSNTDNIVSNINTVGKFEIIDSQTKEILMNNNDIKNAEVLYNSSSSKGVSVYLNIKFNKEGKEKIKNISSTYVKTENENTINENTANVTETSENTTEETSEETNKSKQIIMKIDDQEIMTTSFDEVITTGELQLSVGSVAIDQKVLQDNIKNAQNYATILGFGNLPIKYNITTNEYILSNIENKDLIIFSVVIGILLVISIIVLAIKYKSNGLLLGISTIGLAAIYLLLIRYANVVISMQSIFGIIITLILNYILNIKLLNTIKEKDVSKALNETYKEFFITIIPVCIMAIAFCFIKWVPINSFGMIMFWGIVIIALYNFIITKTLLKIKTEE